LTAKRAVQVLFLLSTPLNEHAPKMDELNSDFAALSSSEAPVRDRRADLLAKADRVRDLGDFTSALALYREAEAMCADLSISVRIAGTMIEQGRAPMAVREWDQALARFADIEEDRELVAVAQISRANTAAYMDLSFRDALQLGRKYFDEFVKPHPLREWKGRKVCSCRCPKFPTSNLVAHPVTSS
jgi:hypothetical protein